MSSEKVIDTLIIPREKFQADVAELKRQVQLLQDRSGKMDIAAKVVACGKVNDALDKVESYAV